MLPLAASRARDRARSSACRRGPPARRRTPAARRTCRREAPRVEGFVSFGTCFLHTFGSSSRWHPTRVGWLVSWRLPPHSEGQREHVVVELTSREVVREFRVRMVAVEPTGVSERHLLVAEPVGLEDDFGTDDVEGFLRIFGV